MNPDANRHVVNHGRRATACSRLLTLWFFHGNDSRTVIAAGRRQFSHERRLWQPRIYFERFKMAKSKRAFSSSEPRQKSSDSYGGCTFAAASPDMNERGISSLNLFLTFEESLRLATALQAAILKLNGYDRRTEKGPAAMTVVLRIKADGNAISVVEKRVPRRTKNGVSLQDNPANP